ncbi:MAG: MFS transporter, partial [Micromonosporaceae bacterium]|nr:MFS transporter [Micromonosporaceae bacterium]
MIDARAARRRFVLISALTWLPRGLGLPVMVLLMEVRGIGLAGVGLVFAVYGIAVASLELPTGGLADVIGRRTVLAASAAVTVGAVVWMAFATSLWMFVAIGVLNALARALSSGPAEAWYVDAVHAAAATAGGGKRASGGGGPDAGELRRGLAQGNAAGSAALAVGTLVGGGLPLVIALWGLLPDRGVLVPLSAPMLLAALAGAGQLAVALLGMPEPERAGERPRFGEVLRDVPATVGRGARLGFRDGLLARVLLTAAALGIALNAIELLTPGRLADLTGNPAAASTWYAIVAAIGFAAVSVGSALGPWVARLLGGGETTDAGRTAATGAVVAAVSLGGLAASASLDGTAGIAAAALAYTGMFLGLGIADPSRSELMHSRASAKERATVLSVDSLLLQAGGALSAIGLGALAAHWSVAPAWWLAAATLL